jgi:nucleoside-diphosphate-sugar epimerase
MRPLIEAADVVINCAALVSVPYSQTMPGAYWRTNATAVMGMLMCRPKRFIQISTSEVFDGKAPPYYDSSPTCPITPYGASKCAGESACRGMAAGVGTVVRVFNLYGPRQYPRAVIPLMVRQALEIQEGTREKATLYGPIGSRAFLYAPWVAEQVIRAIDDHRPLIQLASLNVIKIADLWPRIALAVGIDPERVEWSKPPGNASPVANLFGYSSDGYETGHALNRLGLEGLEETVAWHRANRHYCSEVLAYQ